MAETFLDGKVTLYPGDCLNALDVLPENLLDAGITDPPYHLASIVKRFGKDGSAPAKDYSGERPQATGAYSRASRGFMGQQWDGGDIAFRPETWAKVLRVLKPGAHLAAFAAPKNVGLLQTAIEAAGFETRDCLLDLIDLDPLAAAFVGSLDDAQRGALFRLLDESDGLGLMAWLFGSGFPKSHSVALDYERELCRPVKRGEHTQWVYKSDGKALARVPPFRAPEANEWAGYGTALKPAFEPIVLARKPLEAGLTVAENCRKWGTGALNIDACRIQGGGASAPRGSSKLNTNINPGWSRPWMENRADVTAREAAAMDRLARFGRWPANVLHDGSPQIEAMFPQSDTGGGPKLPEQTPGSSGSAARFFYTAKADSDDRLGSKHPTVKPLDLMQYLVRLLTRPGQTVLDCFAGTGTTGEASFREGRRAVLIERAEKYQDDIRRRMRLALGGAEERARESLKAAGKVEAADTLPLFGGIDATAPPAPVGRSMESLPMKKPSVIET